MRSGHLRRAKKASQVIVRALARGVLQLQLDMHIGLDGSHFGVPLKTLDEMAEFDITLVRSPSLRGRLG